MKHAAPSFLLLWFSIALCVAMSSAVHAAKTLKFSGYEWQVRQAPLAGPGPNLWDENNAWVDGAGHLHLKISLKDGKWYCAELQTKERLGFGRYQWQIVGRPDLFDPQIVLGLFPYTVREVGPDGTNEIDIEFARWGKAANPIGNFAVWPAIKEVKGTSHNFEFKLDGDYTTSRFDWSAHSIQFQMLGGHRDDDQNEIAKWKYAPAEPEKYVPQNPLPLHINFWLFRGQPPQNGQEAEIIISKFSFLPEKKESPLPQK